MKDLLEMLLALSKSIVVGVVVVIVAILIMTGFIFGACLS